MQPDEPALRLKRVLQAPASTVFRACTVPEELAKWWGPQGFTTPAIELDLRVGGRYRFGMQPPGGDLFHLTGEFCEVDPPSRLAYTFVWEPPDPDDRETVVTLSFRDVDGSTEVNLTQGVFVTEARRALHEQGWPSRSSGCRNGCRHLDQKHQDCDAKAVSGQDVGPASLGCG